jgi:hypothetical protein
LKVPRSARDEISERLKKPVTLWPVQAGDKSLDPGGPSDAKRNVPTPVEQGIKGEKQTARKMPD